MPRLHVQRTFVLLLIGIAEFLPPVSKPSPLVRLPVDVFLLIANELPLDSKYLLSKTCKSIRSTLAMDWPAELQKLPRAERRQVLVRLAYNLREHLYCAICCKLHRVDVADVPFNPKYTRPGERNSVLTDSNPKTASRRNSFPSSSSFAIRFFILFPSSRIEASTLRIASISLRSSSTVRAKVGCAHCPISGRGEIIPLTVNTAKRATIKADTAEIYSVVDDMIDPVGKNEWVSRMGWHGDVNERLSGAVWGGSE
ncbi:uncharacterized protein DNG_08249 [Cephalotrichum gorgonifer]|uniref:F-box domain-containing protein n=1 Tax=Cephalotrichum gorgonifer TaxID=2041049 RepID=A0AAE8N639_9PEZI|nr:uncharacterized protein DNG_08249 [Cephalotrichum gorgonifer]